MIDLHPETLNVIHYVLTDSEHMQAFSIFPDNLAALIL